VAAVKVSGAKQMRTLSLKVKGCAPTNRSSPSGKPSADAAYTYSCGERERANRAISQRTRWIRLFPIAICRRAA
jgi:hypothetical protein